MNNVTSVFFEFQPDYTSLDIALINHIYNKLHILNKEKFPINNIEKKIELRNYCFKYYNKNFILRNYKKEFKKKFGTEFPIFIFNHDTQKYFRPSNSEIEKKAIVLCDIIDLKITEESKENAIKIIENMYNIRFGKKNIPDIDDLKIAILNNNNQMFLDKILDNHIAA